jgi:hypothetical protein
VPERVIPAASISEWNPSAVMDSAPVAVPMAILPKATPAFSTSVIHSTRATCPEMSLPCALAIAHPVHLIG